MDIQRQFPGVHWVWGGGISFVYEVHSRIVVKVPKNTATLNESNFRERDQDLWDSLLLFTLPLSGAMFILHE